MFLILFWLFLVLFCPYEGTQVDWFVLSDELLCSALCNHNWVGDWVESCFSISFI